MVSLTLRQQQEQMTEIQSFFPDQSQPSLEDCSTCSKRVTFALRGDTIPIHNPITGDMICGECHAKWSSRHESKMESEDLPWLSHGLVALPLYLLKKKESEMNVGDSASIEVKIDPKYDKCLYHEDVKWDVVDLDNLVCVCFACGQQSPLHNHQMLGEAVSTIRERMATLVTTPLLMQNGRSTGVTPRDRSEQKNGTTEQHARITLAQLAIQMDKTVKAFHDWIQYVKETSALLCNKLLLLRLLISEGPLRRRLESAIQWRDNQFQDACNIYIHRLQRMLRCHHVISGTLMEGMKLVGLDLAESDGSVTMQDVLDVLRKRPGTLSMVGEEVMVLRTLTCLKETLINSDSWLLKMTGGHVKRVLNQSDGLRERLASLNTKVKSIPLTETKGSKTKKKKMEKENDEEVGRDHGVVEEAMRLVNFCLPLLLAPQSEFWQSSMRQVDVESSVREAQNKVLETVLGALVYEDDELKPMTHSTLQLIKDSRAAMGEANASFVDGIIQSETPGADPVPLYLMAEELGCTHPLLYHHLNVQYDMPSSGAPPECFERADKLIRDGHMLGQTDVAFLYGKLEHGDKQAFAYLSDLEREGYSGYELSRELGYKYQHGFGCERDSLVALDHYQMAADRGCPLSNQFMYLTWDMAGERNPLCRDKGLLALLEAEEKGINVDRHLYFLLSELIHREDNPSKKVLGRFRNKAEMILYYCDLLIQRRSSSGYQHLGHVYAEGIADVPIDQPKAIAIMEEADRLGLANVYTYDRLMDLYLDGEFIPQDGSKVLMYGAKALEVTMDPELQCEIYDRMATVYRRGIPPVKQDRREASELRRKARALRQ